MATNTPAFSSETLEFSSPIKEVLTKAQKAVLDRVLLILEINPALNKNISRTFERNFSTIVSDREKFNILLEKIGAVEMVKLGEIEKRFNSGEISNEQAITDSKEIIEKYTTMKLTALKGNIDTTA